MKIIASLLLLAASLFAQSTPPGQTTNPVQKVNVQWVNGIAPGYWPQKVSGLTLAVGAGLVNCDGAISTYAGGNLVAPDNATSYGYLNPTSGCTPTISTTQPSCGTLLFAKIIAASGQITSITDMRLAAFYCTGGSPGSLYLNPNDINFGSVQSGQVSFPVNVTISNTGNGTVIETGETLSGDPFSSPSLDICRTSIEGLSSCSIPLTCAPDSAGTFDGTLTITSTAPIDASNPLVVNLHCTGTSGATYSLSLNCSGTGKGTVTSDETPPLINLTCNNGAISGVFANNYASGHVTTLTPTADPNSTFAGFSGCGLTAEPWECTVSAATNITATFNLTPVRRTINISGVGQGTGTVASDINDVLDGLPLACTSTSSQLTGKCFGTFNEGDTVELTATAASSGTGTCSGGDCTFQGFTGVPGCSSSPCDITLASSNVNVGASFAVPASGTWSVVQSVSKTSCGAGTSCALPFSAAGSTSGLIVLAHMSSFSSVINAMTGGCAVAWTISPTNAFHINKSDVAYCTSATTGATTTTVGFNISNTPSDVMVIEVSNASGILYDTAAKATNATCSPCNGVPLTLNGPNDLIMQWADNTNTVSVTAISGGAGYTASQHFGASNAGADAIAINTTNGAAPSWTQSAASATSVGAIAFMSTAGAPTSYTFNVACAGSGSGDVTASGITAHCAAGVPSGTTSTTVSANGTLNLASIPLAGSVFVSYSGAGCSTNPNCQTISISTNTTVTVNFSTSGTQNYYVGGTGASDSNDGLSATVTGGHGPWATISKFNASGALLGATGTTINVAAGTYSPSSTINFTRNGTATSRITYLSTTPYGAIISRLAGGLISVSGNYTDIQGFTMTSPGTNGWAINIIGGTLNTRILNNYMYDFTTSNCGSYGVITDGTQTTAAIDPLYYGNVIRHAGNYGYGSNSCVTLHGIYSVGQRAIIENNIVSGVTGWGIKRNMRAAGAGPGIVSNNTVFNNGGGLVADETNDSGYQAEFNYNTWANNVIVNNGTDATNGGRCGIHYYRVGHGTSPPTDQNNLVTNNLIYGNKPYDLCHREVACGNPSTASGTTPVSGIPISGSDATGNAGGCPASASRTDSGGTSATFINFHADTNTAPYASYDPQDYRLKAATPSTGINGGSPPTQCAIPPGLTPCVPAKDFNNVTRPTGVAVDIGAFEQ